MNCLKALAAAAVLAALGGVPALAQAPQIDLVNGLSDLTLDVDAPEVSPAAYVASGSACPPPSCNSGGCRSGCRSCACGLGEPWSLFGEHCSGITAGGWLQAGFHSYNTGMFNDYPDKLNFHQAWLYSEKPLDTRCGWDWGYRADYVYGTDAPDTQAYGNRLNTYDFGWFNGGFYGHAIPQLYAEVGYCDLSLKVGHFYTILGYEVVAAPDNFFYSHAFTHYYAEPFTHTGALATYKARDNLTLYGGWTAGFDTGFDKFGGDIFLGGISMELGDYVSAAYAVTAGNLGFGTNASGYSHSIVVDLQLTGRLNYVFQTDFIDYGGVVTHPASLAGAVLDPFLLRRYGVNNYLFYEINECWKAGVRFEWFNVEQNPQNDRTDLYELTFGLNYRPHPNFIVRPELRWDKDDFGFTVDPARNDSVGLGMDVIFLF
ncbi:MAG: outer membrane beta-barrel protein [Planctomycetota bacterium]|jgi:hypothetical protein